MSAETLKIFLPSQTKEAPKMPVNGVGNELSNKVDLHILSGDRINTANGKKLNKANGITFHQSSEKFSRPQEVGEAVKDVTMSVTDLFKDGGAQMMEKVFGANVDGRKVSFPESDVSFHLAPSEKGSALATFQNGDKTELRSLHGWAARDAETDYGPAVDFISPQRKDGSFEMFKIREGKVTHAVVDNPSTAGEYLAYPIAKELPQNERKGEDSPSKNYTGAILRDLPFSGMTEEQQTFIETMEKVGSEKEEKALDAIHKFMHKEGPVSEEDIKMFEKQTAESLKEVVAFKKK